MAEKKIEISRGKKGISDHWAKTDEKQIYEERGGMKIEILPASPLQPREGVNFENTRKEKQIKIRNHMENFETLPR